MKAVAKFVKEICIPRWLTIVLLLEFILRIPSFFEPFSYGDEMIYLTLGNAIRKGLTLYKDIHDNKPPLLYFTAALAGNVFWFRMILAIFMILTTVLFWELLCRLFERQKKIQMVAVSTFAVLTTIPLLEGNIANAELFMIGFSIAGFLLIFSQKTSLKKAFFAGILFSLGTLFKIPAAFDILAVIFLWFCQVKDIKSFVEFFKKSLVISVGFLVPIVFTFVWYYLKGAFPQYLHAAFLQNVGYLSSFRPSDVQKSFLVRNAPLLVRAGIVALGLLLEWIFRKKLSKPFLLTSGWLLVSLFAVTLSERPYPHYLIQSIPPISILIGIFAFSQNMEQTLTIIPLLLAALVPAYYKFYYYPTFSYYQRFFDYAAGAITRQEYFDRFDGNVNRNYAVSDYINKTDWPNDKIFVWGDSPPIYALTKKFPPIKFVATYHINDFSSQSEVVGQLNKNKPTTIIILPESSDFPLLRQLVNKNYVLIQNIDGAEVWQFVKPSILSIISVR